MTDDTAAVLTLDEVARALGVHHRTALRWVQSGRLHGYKTPGGHWRVSREALVQADLSAAEFAALVGVHKLTVRRWCEAGKLECHKSAGDRGHWRIPMSEVLVVGARRAATPAGPKGAQKP